MAGISTLLYKLAGEFLSELVHLIKLLKLHLDNLYEGREPGVQ